MAKQQSAYRAHFLFLALYFLCNVTLAIHSGENAGLFIMLVWNAFLSFLPRLFARHTALARSRQKRIWIMWAFLWLIFWPNTFYVSTDIVPFHRGYIFKENFLPGNHIFNRPDAVGKMHLCCYRNPVRGAKRCKIRDRHGARDKFRQVEADTVSGSMLVSLRRRDLYGALPAA